MGRGTRLELHHLRTFLTIARVGSFNKAAVILDYAQSSVSGQIKSLEDELGTKLFERFGREVCLTEEGKRLLVYAEQLLKLADETKESICGDNIPKGTVTIGAPESLSIFRLPNILQDYRKRYPQVKLILKLGSCRDIYGWLKTNLIDLAFLLDTPTETSEFIIESLIHEPITLIASLQHPLSQKKKILSMDLAGQDLVLVEENGCCYRMIFETMLAEAGVQAASIQEFGSVETIKRWVISGLGISILPLITVEKEIETGLLKSLKWDASDFNIYTQMLYRKDKWLSPALKAMIELVKEDMKN